MIPATPNTPAEPAIKLCPFCDWGFPPILRWDMRNFRQRGRYCRVVCTCGARGPERESEAEAIAAWNRRAGGGRAMSAQHPAPWRAEGRDNGKRGRLRDIVRRLLMLRRGDIAVPMDMEKQILAEARAALGAGETPTGKGVGR